MRLSVIIVNYNVASELDQCINSFKKVIGGIKYELIVIDNFSTERDIKDLKEKYPDVRFEFLERNLGFGLANNYGVSIARGSYLLLLNPDTVLCEDFVTPITDFMARNQNVGACAPMLMYPKGKYQNSCGPRLGFLYETAEAFMLINFYRKLYRKFYLGKRANIIRVGWLSAACMLIKREVFNKVGGFDLKYFLNYEDIDLCRRLQDFGFVNYYFPHYKCIHLDHSSQKKNYELLVYSRYESRKLFASAHYSFPIRTYVRFIHLIGIIIRLLTSCIFFSGDEFKQRFNGYLKSLKLYLNIVS